MSIQKDSFAFGAGISSMTGFGRSEKTYPGLRISVEIRTVNNRFCDIGMKIPRDLNPMETEIRELIRKKVNRGRVNLLITMERDAEDEFALHIDLKAAKVCHKMLSELNEELGRSDPITLSQLLHFSDQFTKLPERTLSDDLKKQVMESLDAALENLLDMRRLEGISLAEDLLVRIEQIDKTRKEIETLADDQPQQQMQLLQERLEQLVSSTPLDPGRLEQEIAILSDKLDITEESVRLGSHCQRFIETLAGEDPAGKRLGFLLQEMNREANTISSKTASADISHHAISLKEEIERIREQIQNLE